MSKPGKPETGAVTRFRVKGRRCPICKQAAVTEHRPFCSKRCAQIDLGRWLGEVYRAPAEEDDWTESEVWSGGAAGERDREG